MRRPRKTEKTSERRGYTDGMKRWLIRIIVCLILGAITTVAIA